MATEAEAAATEAAAAAVAAAAAAVGTSLPTPLSHYLSLVNGGQGGGGGNGGSSSSGSGSSGGSIISGSCSAALPIEAVCRMLVDDSFQPGARGHRATLNQFCTASVIDW